MQFAAEGYKAAQSASQYCRFSRPFFFLQRMSCPESAHEPRGTSQPSGITDASSHAPVCYCSATSGTPPSSDELETARVRPKRAPNSFILYKNDLRKRYPEIYDLDLGSEQLLRVIARMWENESPGVRGAYEEQYATNHITAVRRLPPFPAGT